MVTCLSCRWSAACPVDLLVCLLREEPCSDLCEDYEYEPGTDEKEDDEWLP